MAEGEPKVWGTCVTGVRCPDGRLRPVFFADLEPLVAEFEGPAG